MAKLIGNFYVVAILVLAFLAKTVLLVAIGEDLMLIFTRERKSLIDSLKKITWGNFFWLLKYEAIVYIIFGLIAAIFYALSSYIWQLSSNGLLALVVLFGVFVLLYPLFYISFSLCSTICVLPVTKAKKHTLLFYFFKPKNILPTYLFYLVRLALEYMFVFVLPFAALYFFKNVILANIFILLGLALPLLLLRGSAYEFKLNILRGDMDVQNIFADHYLSELNNGKK
jgi:hypothetical protein